MDTIENHYNEPIRVILEYPSGRQEHVATVMPGESFEMPIIAMDISDTAKGQYAVLNGKGVTFIDRNRTLSQMPEDA